jgi:hypothetical protein
MQFEVKEIKPIAPPKEYVLTLDQNELDYLAHLIGSTGGWDGEGGWRQIGNGMGSKLYEHSTYPLGHFNMVSSGAVINKLNPIKPK